MDYHVSVQKDSGYGCVDLSNPKNGSNGLSAPLTNVSIQEINNAGAINWFVAGGKLYVSGKGTVADATLQATGTNGNSQTVTDAIYVHAVETLTPGDATTFAATVTNYASIEVKGV